MTVKLFVGNLSESTTAVTVGKLFETIGLVKSATIETRNEVSRGFGYVEMQDEEAAQTAMRQLNGYNLNGKPLRVEIAYEKSKAPATRRPRARGARRGFRGGFAGYGGFGAPFGGYGGFGGFNAPFNGYGYGAFPARRGRGRFAGRPRRGRRPTRRQLNPDAPSSQTRVHIGNLPYSLTKEDLTEALKGYQVKDIILTHRRFNTALNVGYAFVEFASAAEQKKFLAEHQTIQLKDRECRTSAAMDVPAEQSK
ncbi:putative RNA recognition motif protein [Monocercomonoides exilis]|uniref:putative RNA recognition motif protein n=1 Tax=Monocercomonoides exilis TaxID=2049356 RepID=UPI00355A329F|nr:putative RNA recognition motif protein [Monocercomonoides exilis]|eukprot:MONOS_9644.1-p1 / transcript=MONOS_9644.1 / gene=MONOS_9644 / organism=Monocercomonoides_exilis_PA203 / gene_product=unspecified product / transcript_product=unspecified product / location=Mono_scaffold00405:34369-35264(-) / protein_length=251 / sequence_SO=supercontig / SO=protein_coding / is_pseudo=false